jgi:hypothetical protein
MSSERVRGLGCGWPVKKAAGSGSVAGGDTRDHRYDGRRSRSRAGQSLTGSPCAVSPLRVKRGGTRGNARIDVQLRRRHGAGVTVSGGRRGSVRGRFVPEWLPPAPIERGAGGRHRSAHNGAPTMAPERIVPKRTSANPRRSPLSSSASANCAGLKTSIPPNGDAGRGNRSSLRRANGAGFEPSPPLTTYK